jgi:hypothetical protein
MPLMRLVDPALVFSEILGMNEACRLDAYPQLIYFSPEGVIKGSEKSLKFENGHLDRETYLTLSHRTNPTFVTRREAIWEIFLATLRITRSWVIVTPLIGTV